MKKYLLLYFLGLAGYFVLYASYLDLTPVHLNQDELAFALNANAISKSLHDFYGTYLPFYFWHLGSFWATPVMPYLLAVILKILPISESTIRLVSVFVGIFNIIIFSFLARRVFKSDKIMILAGFILATTPVHFIHSRLVLDNLYTVPFILVWLYFLKRYFDEGKYKWVFISCLSLGIGIHSYHAAKIVMPIYFLITLMFLFLERNRSILVAVIAFSIPIIAFIPWLSKYPDTLLNQVNYISGLDSSVDADMGIWGVFNTKRIGEFTSNYVTYFSPEILFIEGDRSLIHSTGRVGAFLMPIAFLVVLGIFEIIYNQKDKFSKIVLIGLATYPVAPSIVSDPQRISRGLVVIPFLLLTSIYGVHFLLKSKERTFRPLLISIVIVAALQFSVFLNDYFSDYRVRSAGWFNYNIGGGMEALISDTRNYPVRAVYLDGNTPFIDLYARFYKAKLDYYYPVEEIVFNSSVQDFSNFPSGSLVLVRHDHVRDVGEFEKIDTILEPDGRETFYIYWRDLEI